MLPLFVFVDSSINISTDQSRRQVVQTFSPVKPTDPLRSRPGGKLSPSEPRCVGRPSCQCLVNTSTKLCPSTTGAEWSHEPLERGPGRSSQPPGHSPVWTGTKTHGRPEGRGGRVLEIHDFHNIIGFYHHVLLIGCSPTAVSDGEHRVNVKKDKSKHFDDVVSVYCH